MAIDFSVRERHVLDGHHSLSTRHKHRRCFPSFRGAFGPVFLQELAAQAVEILRLRNAHRALKAMMLKPDGKTLDNSAGRKFGNLKLSGLIRRVSFRLRVGG